MADDSATAKGKQPTVQDSADNDSTKQSEPSTSTDKGKAVETSSKQEQDVKSALNGLSPKQLQELMALNPALVQEVAQATGNPNPSPEQAAELLKKMSLADIMTGLAAGGKGAKDMASHKFWQTQPVPRFGDEEKLAKEGPLRIQTVDDVSKEPAALVDGFEWVTMDLKSEEEIKEVYELLNGHYVEDDDSTFRFNYSPSILRW